MEGRGATGAEIAGDITGVGIHVAEGVAFIHSECMRILAWFLYFFVFFCRFFVEGC